MNIAIDIRHLTRPMQSGVGEYTTQLLKSLLSLDKNNSYTLFSSGTSACQKHIPKYLHNNARMMHLPIPNKILNMSLMCAQRPVLDKLLGQNIDLFFFSKFKFYFSIK
jgi:hypothetical protein